MLLKAFQFFLQTAAPLSLSFSAVLMRTEEEPRNSECLQPSVKHSGRSVTFSGCTLANDVCQT